MLRLQACAIVSYCVVLLNPGLCAHEASPLSTELCPQPTQWFRPYSVSTPPTPKNSHNLLWSLRHGALGCSPLRTLNSHISLECLTCLPNKLPLKLSLAWILYFTKLWVLPSPPSWSPCHIASGLVDSWAHCSWPSALELWFCLVKGWGKGLLARSHSYLPESELSNVEVGWAGSAMLAPVLCLWK